MYQLKPYVSLLRLSHWSKALFVFLGVIYSDMWIYLPKAFFAALSFCLIASCVYIYNDFQDREADRLHPKKQKRALASGEISLFQALVFFVVLLALSLTIAAFITPALILIIGVYFSINLLYNYRLKAIPVLDVLCIASGFMLRVLAGTVGIGLPISWWLVVAATLLSLLIALSKRRMEKSLNLINTVRPVLDKYTLEFLDELTIGTSLACFLTYLFYIVYVHELQYYFMLTLPFAAIGLLRFLEITIKEADEDDPVSVFFKDGVCKLNLVCFTGLTLLALNQ